MQLDRLDHLVLTVADIETTCAFYERVLGMARVSIGAGRVARSGALGPIQSVYLRDPDGNLLEIAVYEPSA
jgi:catechol 2,3-dioxygenase-like lactoylglutathione lyase family enzyme